MIKTLLVFVLPGKIKVHPNSEEQEQDDGDEDGERHVGSFQSEICSRD